MELTSALRTEYADLFETCDVRPDHKHEIDALVDEILRERGRYEAVSEPLEIPWQFVGVIHCMETGLRFDRHLHNGDPLARRTVHVPAGRPPGAKEGDFTWEESATDALQLRVVDHQRDWSLAAMLYRLEGYNGWGYRRWHPLVRSPYLWSYSNHYARGKYVADGTWVPNAVSRQCGSAVLLRVLAEHGEYEADAPLVAPAATAIPVIAYYRGGPGNEPARRLQVLLNEVLGTALVPDGKPGERTSDAVERLLGHKLVGDPRG